MVSMDVWRMEARSGKRRMNREYHKWHSDRLGREMELLVFGHTGRPVVVFPTSGGRFFDFEDRGMVAAVSEKIVAGQLQIFCVDSLDMESWYNRQIPARQRVARHVEYEEYVLREVVPLIRLKNQDVQLVALGISFGGYHAVNIALRHPGVFRGFASLSGTFDLTGFLDGFYNDDCNALLPTHYLPEMNDRRLLERYQGGSYVLATGWDDHCLEQNQKLDRILSAKEIPHQLYVWDSANAHDWPTWQRMAQVYL